MCLRGHKEQTEGGDLCVYLKNLFASWLGSDSTSGVNLANEYRIGPLKRYHQRNPRDILMKFPDWHTKTSVVDAFQENQNFLIDNVRITLLPYLTIITLSKCQNFTFLTSVLQ